MSTVAYKPKCPQCIYWGDHLDYEEFGFCLRYPPQIVEKTYETPDGIKEWTSQYPQVLRNLPACGEFKLDIQSIGYVTSRDTNEFL